MFEAVVAIVTLHQRFDFQLSTQHHPDGVIDVEMPGLMRPTAGIWVTATPYSPPRQPAPQEQAQHAQHSSCAAQDTPFISAPLPQHAQQAQHAQHAAAKSPFLAMPAPQGLFGGKHGGVPVLRREQGSLHRSVSGSLHMSLHMSRGFSGHRG